MAQFLIKVNATRCPASCGLPASADEWANGWFDVTSRTRNYTGPVPSAFDYCLIWVNELPRDRAFGGGLIAAAIIQAVRGDPEPETIQIFEPRLFSSSPVSRNVIQNYEATYGRDDVSHVIIRVHRDRHKTLYHLSDTDVDELLGRTET